MTGYRPIDPVGLIRTEISCHHCTSQIGRERVFLAELDYSLDGAHVVLCPYCGHEHFRVIKGGKITEERWSPSSTRIDVSPDRVKKLEIPGNTVAEYLRSHWLRASWQNRSDVQL